MPTVEVLELSEELANKHEAPTCKWRLCVYGWKYRVNDELKATQPPGEWWWNKQLQGWWVPVDDFDKVERLLMDVQVWTFSAAGRLLRPRACYAH